MRLRYVLLSAAMIALVSPVRAQQDSEPADNAGDVEAGTEAEAGDEDSAAGELGAAEARQAAEEDVFIPSEEVPPDQQVTFPVDI